MFLLLTPEILSFFNVFLLSLFCSTHFTWGQNNIIKVVYRLRLRLSVSRLEGDFTILQICVTFITFNLSFLLDFMSFFILSIGFKGITKWSFIKFVSSILQSEAVQSLNGVLNLWNVMVVSSKSSLSPWALTATASPDVINSLTYETCDLVVDFWICRHFSM